MTDVLNFEITLLTPDEAKEVWKQQNRRAPDFARYQAFIDTRDVGDGFAIPVPDSDPEKAKDIMFNFNEAAKHRTGGPVVLRWRKDTRTVTETVTGDNGATGEVEVVYVDRIRALLVSTEAIIRRARRSRGSESANGTVDASEPSEPAAQDANEPSEPAPAQNEPEPTAPRGRSNRRT